MSAPVLSYCRENSILVLEQRTDTEGGAQKAALDERESGRAYVQYGLRCTNGYLIRRDESAPN